MLQQRAHGPIKAQPAAVAAFTITSLLGLAACADPCATTATAPTSVSITTAAGRTFNLSPEQDRLEVSVDPTNAALVLEAIKADGRLTVVPTSTGPCSQNATVTEARKEKFDFATYRNDLLPKK